MTIVVNKYDGEFTLKIYGVNYPMRLNAKVYGQFETETGRDLNSVFSDVLNELNRLQFTGSLEKPDEFSASEMIAGLCSVVDMKHAAWLFYLSAKAMDNIVSFDEIQEAVLLEGITQNKTCPVDGEIVRSYPQLFLKYTINAMDIGGEKDEGKKLKHSKPSLLARLRSALLT